MNFYRNRAINPKARQGTIKQLRDKQPMPPTSGGPVATATVNTPPKVELSKEGRSVVQEFDKGTKGMGSYIVNNAKPAHIPIINAASSNAEAFSNLLLSLRVEYESLRKEELKEEGGAEGEEGAGDAAGDTGDGDAAGEAGAGDAGNGGAGGDQPTYDVTIAEAFLRGWVGTVSRLMYEAQAVSDYNYHSNGAEYSLLKDDIYAVRDILKSMVNTARAINRKEGKVFSIERRPVGKIMLDRRVVTCYLLTIRTVLPTDGKVTVKYAEDPENGVVLKCALMRNGYRWIAVPLDKVGFVINELKPISYSHRVGGRTTRIIFGSLFGHGLISQVFETASKSDLYYNDLAKIKF